MIDIEIAKLIKKTSLNFPLPIPIPASMHQSRSSSSNELLMAVRNRTIDSEPISPMDRVNDEPTK